MARKITDLTSATTLALNDIMIVNQTTDKQATIELLRQLILDDYLEKSADYIILDDDANVVYVTTSTTDRTVTLPTLADNLGRIIEVHKVDSASGIVIIDGEGAETIDGVTTIDLDSQYDYAKLRAGTSSWILVEYKNHGSNADGTWVRHADGTMDCYETMDNTVSNSSSWTFPQEFNDTTINCSGNHQSAAGNGIVVTFSTPTTTSVAWGSIVTSTGSYYASAAPHSLKAHGRWRA